MNYGAALEVVARKTFRWLNISDFTELMSRTRLTICASPLVDVKLGAFCISGLTSGCSSLDWPRSLAFMAGFEDRKEAEDRKVTSAF